MEVPNLHRYFIELSYKGTAYSGWQAQPNAKTVQQTLDNALKTLFGFEVATLGSGRTDAGVHAKKQVVHVDLPKLTSHDLVSHQLNGILPYDIAIHTIREVKLNSHARFDALYRKYEYKIHTRKSPFLQDSSYLFTHPLNIAAMQKASYMLIGHKNYQSFSKVHTDVNHFDCEIFTAQWEPISKFEIKFTVQADRFLRGMVRALCGTLLEIGLGRLNLEGFKKILNGNHRSLAARALPAHGLYLIDVGYPDSVYL